MNIQGCEVEVTDCIITNDEHCSPCSDLVQAGVDALNAAGIPLPPVLAAWQEQMARIRAWEVRRDAERT